jgi:hypothetical protein
VEGRSIELSKQNTHWLSYTALHTRSHTKHTYVCRCYRAWRGAPLSCPSSLRLQKPRLRACVRRELLVHR